ncbi:MAG: glycosyltransferase [Elusimicrobiota bacterium]
MKILRINSASYPAFRFGGPIFCAHALDKELIRVGVKVDVLATNAGQIDKSIPQNRWALVDGVRTKFVQYYGYEHYTFSPALLWESFKIARNYDLIVSDAVWNFSALAACLVSWIYNKPYVIAPHGVLYRETFCLKSKYKKLFYWNVIAKWCVKRANAIWFTTTDEKNKVTHFLNIRTRSYVIPNGVRCSDFDNLPPPGSFASKFPILAGKPYLLFLGRITRKKGLDILVKAFINLAIEYDDLHLAIVGPDDEGYGAELSEQLRQGQVLARTLFTDMLVGRDKLAAYADARLFVLSSYSENFGVAVVEAMCCGCPVVISDKVGIHEEVRKSNAGIVVRTTSESVQEGIRSLLNSPKLRRQFSERGKLLAWRKYDIEVTANRVREVYAEIANNSNHPDVE